LTLLEAEQLLFQAFSLLNKTRDDSVLCGTTPRITSSSRGEVILFPGDSLSLNCSAAKEEGLKYAWRKNDELIGESVDGSFYVRGVTKDNEGAYVCIVSNNKGSTFSNVTIVSSQQAQHHSTSTATASIDWQSKPCDIHLQCNSRATTYFSVVLSAH